MCILMVVDSLKGLPKNIKLDSPNGSWIQTLLLTIHLWLVMVPITLLYLARLVQIEAPYLLAKISKVLDASFALSNDTLEQKTL